jgi:hypothetical protein
MLSASRSITIVTDFCSDGLVSGRSVSDWPAQVRINDNVVVQIQSEFSTGLLIDNEYAYRWILHAHNTDRGRV